MHDTFKVVLPLLLTDDHEMAHNVHAYSINFSQIINKLNLSRLKFQNFLVGECPQTPREIMLYLFFSWSTSSVNFSTPPWEILDPPLIVSSLLRKLLYQVYPLDSCDVVCTPTSCLERFNFISSCYEIFSN